jgi:alpha-galactosidase
VLVEKQSDGIHFKTPQAEFSLDKSGYLQARLLIDGHAASLEDNAEAPSVELTTAKHVASDFVRDLSSAKISPANGKLGTTGKRVEVQGYSAGTGLEELLTVETYDDFPGLAILSASYKNPTQKTISLDQVTLQRHRLNAALADANAKPHEMWAFFGASLQWGKDDVVQIPAKFEQENPLGTPVGTHDDSGSVGGGIPIAAFWTRNVGLAVGHLETLPLSLSILVKTGADGKVEVGVTVPANAVLKPGDTFATPRTFVMIYHGDYYEPLRMWSRAVEREGMIPPKNGEENYAVSWCGWGYQANVTPKQMTGTIPKLSELGIHWATV